MKQLALLALFLPVVACATPSNAPQQTKGPKTLAAVVGKAELRAGFLDLWVDADQGKVWLNLPAADDAGIFTECLYVHGLRRGLGSNDVGLDRGQLQGPVLVRFKRAGKRVFLEQPNLDYRALDAGVDEERATQESFAASILWSAPILAEKDGRALIELTPMLLMDWHGVASTLQRSGQGGGWRVDAERSALEAHEVRAFPDNVELEALLTFAGTAPGREVRSVTPSSNSVSLIQHQSFVRLPDASYSPREHDPRMGAGTTGFADYASDLADPLNVRWVNRHRLAAGEPLVYYVDSGAPEPLRSALVEGASWWSEAFTAAGFPGSFEVRVLPDGVHPLDVRYNVIQWVHRSTRGWSYGNSIVDPRTGEIIKGHVSLGSLRVRQDRMLFEGLLGAAGSGKGGPLDPVELALARIRQLSAHEVGHTLGLSHNFAASTYGERASVMDYPAPLVSLDRQGDIDVSKAYGIGLGAWDVHAIRMLYGQPAAGASDEQYLAPLLARVGRHDLRFSTDNDARPAGGAHPYAALWDNGSDAPLALNQSMAVRAKAMADFGLHCLPTGWPVGSLQEVFVPVYMHHRYQVEAAAKWVAGVDYDPADRDSQTIAQSSVPAADQERALVALLATLEPSTLDIDDAVLALLLPGAPAGLGNGERFEGRAGLTFDPLEAAATAADVTLTYLLNTERAVRLVDQHRRDSNLLGLGAVIERLATHVCADTGQEDARALAVREVVQEAVIRRLIGLAGNASVPARVRDRAMLGLGQLQRGAGGQLLGGAGAVRRIQRFFDRPAPEEQAPARAAGPPPGSPIGCCAGFYSAAPRR
ncbi:MAG: hypothetical protein ACI8QC_000372 [Planctomycetota bacterium]|jgi:hypothetical protein